MGSADRVIGVAVPRVRSQQPSNTMRPIAVGCLHHGPVSDPAGSGHQSLVVGWDPASQSVLMHDLNGETDLVGGNDVPTAIGTGNGLRYSARNWGRRWMVEGPGRGWWLELAVG